MHKTRLLFLCTGNSCRSQMAEGWANHLKSDTIDAFSAGIEKHGLNPLAVEVMAEAGVDISYQQSTRIDELPNINFEWIITLCGHADESCPVFPGKRFHYGFDDPPSLAADAETEEETLQHYRRVRDQIKEFVATLPGSLANFTEE